MHVIERKNAQCDRMKERLIKIECATETSFEDVNKFFLSTKIRLKSFSESSFQSGKMKSRGTRGKYRK